MFTAFRQSTAFALWLMLVISYVLADTGVDNMQQTKTFKVSAQVVKGCLLGSEASDTSHFGTISFGDISSLSQNVDTVSSRNAGSIVIKCTPNIAATIAIDSGIHTTSSISGGRFLANSKTNETLRYQLYQDASYSIIWGNGGNGGEKKQITATGAVEEHVIYARLFATSTLPSPGTYTDTLLVTVSY